MIRAALLPELTDVHFGAVTQRPVPVFLLPGPSAPH